MKRYLSVIIFLFSASINISQTYELAGEKPQFKFKSLSIEQGLSQSNVRSILQDKQGFLWLGTQDGLNRFDGYNFLVFRNIIDDSNSLSHNYIYGLAEDKDGNIWIATGGGGISRYNPFDNSFKNYTFDSNNLNLITVLSIYVDSDNQIWAGSYLIGLSKYDPEKDSFISFVHDVNNPKSIPSNTILSIYEDKEGTLWLGSDDTGLIQFDRSESAFRSYTEKDGLASNYVNSISENREGNIVIGTLGGLSIFNKRGMITNYFFNQNDPGSLSSNKIKTVFADKGGDLFIGTVNAGINYFDPGEKIFYKYRAEDKSPFALSDNVIFSFYEDRSGIIWVATGRGLNKIENSKKFNLLLGPDSKEPLSGKNVWSIIEDSDHNLWAGTDQGLYKISIKNKKIKKITGDVLRGKIEDKIIYSLSEDKYGNIWIASNSGLSSIDKQSNKISTYYNNQGDDSYNYNVIRSIFIDGDIIWLGTNTRGIVKFDILQKRFISFKPAIGNFELLNKYTVFRIYKDQNGNYWFCTTFGLFQYKPKSDELIFSISTVDEESRRFTKIHNQSLSIYEDDDFFWIGTAGGGLLKFVPGKGIVKRYTEQQGLSNNVVYGILPDSFGNLWLSTNKGLSKFNMKENSFKNYYIEDGLSSNEFNVGACLKSSSGMLYFGGISGIVSFYPEEIKDNSYIPPVAVTDFKVFDKPFLNKLDFNDGEIIELSYSDNFFSFEFTALDFTNSEKNEYAYFLEGFDNDWNYISSRHFASYTNVDPGEYIFKVKGSNNDGVWNEQGASIKVIIAPPFYRTWWAYTLYGIIFITVLLSIRQYELNKRKRKEEAIVREERENSKLREADLRAAKAELQARAIESEKEIEKQNIRYRIASDLHDEIGSNLSSITLLSNILTKKLSGDKTKRNEISEVLGKLADINSASKSSAESIRDIVWFINPLSDQLGSLISRMKETANTMLGNINYEIVTNVKSSTKKISPDVRRNIYLIYKETLNNIIKHSEANKVNISIEKENHVLIVTVEDNGVGFEEAKVQYGNGLRNLKSRTENILGELMIKSSVGKGTEVSLKVNIA